MIVILTITITITPSPPIKSLDFRGFDSSRLLIIILICLYVSWVGLEIAIWNYENWPYAETHVII